MTRSCWIGIGLTVLVAGLAYGLFLRHGVAPAVIGYNLVPSERVLFGEVPYRDFIYNYTPGVLWLNALLFKLLGTTLMTARLGVYCFKLAAVLLLYLVGRRYLPGWLALMPVMMTLCWVGYGDILKVFPTQYGMVLLLGAWLLVTRSNQGGRPDGIDAGRGAKSVMLAAAGALAGGVFIFKQNVGLFVCAAVVLIAAASAWSHSGRAAGDSAGPQPSKLPKLSELSRLTVVLAGIVAVVVPAAAYLTLKSALGPMLDHFRRHAVAYEEAKGIALPAPTALLVSILAVIAVVTIGLVLHRTLRGLVPLFCATVMLAFLIVIAAGDRRPSGPLYRSLVAQVYYLPVYTFMAGAIWVAAEYIKGSRARAASVLGIVFMPAAAFIEVFPRSDPDHLVRVLPPSLLLICVLTYELGRRFAAANSFDAGTASRSNAASASGAPLMVESASADSHCPAQLDSQSHSMSRRPVPFLLVGGVAILISAIGIRVTWAPQFDGAFRLVENSPLEFERARGVYGSELEASRFNKIVEYVQQHSSPGDPIFTTARKMTATYFFAARPNTTRMLWFDSAGIPDEAREEVYQEIRSGKYKLILTGGGGDGESDRTVGVEAYERRVGALLNESYHKTATIAGINIFEPASSDR